MAEMERASVLGGTEAGYAPEPWAIDGVKPGADIGDLRTNGNANRRFVNRVQRGNG